MNYEDLIQNFAGRIGLDEFTPDENGTCQLVSEEALITIQDCPDVKKILIFAPVAEIPLDTNANVFRKCLEANFMYSGTMGSTLSIDAEHNMLMMTTYLDKDVINDQDFYDAVILFSTSLAKWQHDFQEMLANDAEETSSDAAEGPREDFYMKI